MKKKEVDKLFFWLYQLAGGLLIPPEGLTDGQRERLTELLLDTLSEPWRYDVEVLERLRVMALKT